MRVFYVLYICDPELSDCVDAIRLLANPAEKSAAHLTVRGPYQRKLPMGRLNEKISGKTIFVDKVGNFFQEHQNTVFFSCFSPDLPLVWKKSDFGFNPHITVYDGKSESFAKRLYSVLRRHRYSFRFTAGRLEPFVSVRKQDGFRLQLTFNSHLVSEILGQRVTAGDIPNLNVMHRLEFIGAICSHISKRFFTDDMPQFSLPLRSSDVGTRLPIL
jgi:hypothetical protein